MRITNNLDLPEPYWRACQEQRVPERGHISVTELLQPPQLRSLWLQHFMEMEMDCSEMFDAFFGNAVHHYLAVHAEPGADAEQRLVWIDPASGWTVHGTPDSVIWTMLRDWKTTRVRALQYDREEWEQQVNLYAHLLRLTGHDIEDALVWPFLRDFDPQKRGEEGYPTAPIVKIPMPLWDADEAHAFLLRRLQLHIAAEAGEYAPCTDEERWMRHTWAVYHKDRDGRAKRAGFKNPEDAKEYAQATLQPIQLWEHFYDVVKREGEPVRCQDWCVVRSVCPQWAEEQAVRNGDLERDLRASLTLIKGGKDAVSTEPMPVLRGEEEGQEQDVRTGILPD